MSEWIKALGIDYGKARIGLAASDDLGMLAHPVETVPAADRDASIARIAEVVEKRGILDVVVGLPLHMNGDEGLAVEGVRKFMKHLKKMLPETMRYHEVDERLSTSMAMDKLHAAGRTARNAKSIIDQAAAVEILQQWLDRRAEEEAIIPFE